MNALAILILACAGDVDPVAMRAIIDIESSGHPWIIGGPQGAEAFSTREKAEVRLSQYISADVRVDVGLSQISTDNFSWLSLNHENAFDPCGNISAGSSVLTHNLKVVSPKAKSPADALVRAVSMYNTGSSVRGAQNGYVQKFARAYARFSDQ